MWQKKCNKKQTLFLKMDCNMTIKITKKDKWG